MGRSLDQAVSDEADAIMRAEAYRIKRGPRHSTSRGHGRVMQAQLVDIGTRLRDKKPPEKPPIKLVVPNAPTLPNFLEALLKRKK